MAGAARSTAPDIIYTEDFEAELAGALARIGASRGLVIAPPSRRFVDRVAAALGDLPFAVVAEARVHVPAEILARAGEALRRFRADTVIAIGGGSAVGLGKALRREHDVGFIAIPTTYAGSEQTEVYGIRRGNEKITGRDPRVRPDVVIYDAQLTAQLPRRLTTQSLLNALAHPVSALSTGSLGEAAKAHALETAREVTRAVEALTEAPSYLEARHHALRAAARAGSIIQAGVLGVHHRIAHRLGGRFDLDHAATHSVLLPHTVRHLADESPALFAELEAAVGSPDLPALLVDLLRRAGAETSLAALGVDRVALEDMLAEDEALPRALVVDAYFGGRASKGVRREDWDRAHLVRAAGPPLAAARVAVVALCGERSNAYDAIKRVLALTGDAPDIAIVSPQAAGPNASVDLEEIATRIRDAIGRTGLTARVYVVGAPPEVHRLSAALGAAGAIVSPGDGSELTALERIRARELLLGRPARDTSPGFGNTHESEALPGALPPTQNSPRRARYGLYAEQINATGFTAPRGENRRSWMYRIRPSAQRGELVRLEHPRFGADFASAPPEPNLLGWKPVPVPDEPTDFVDGLATIGGAGSPGLRRGFAVHVYAANRSMESRAFSSADGEMLLVPERGRLTLLTENGVLDVDPGQIALLPRGLTFSVLLRDSDARGWVGEVYGRSFRLPERGPVGANGLADPRHFRAPRAFHEDRLVPGYRITTAFSGALFEATQDYSPYDVVAWHGNLTPYVYDLASFSPVGNTLFDHGDPSVFTVVTAPLDEQGAHSLDFVFFPARWDVTEGTFRPPFFHRNAVTELNGIIREPGGTEGSAFQAGGCFLTPLLTPHGVRAEIVERVLALSDAAADAPRRLGGASMWFQFETALPMSLSRWAMEADHRIRDWHQAFGTYRTHYAPGAAARDGE